MFKSAKALIAALVQTEQVLEGNVEKISLNQKGEWMIVDKTNPKVALGYVTITYLGVFPGYGKKYDCYARYA